ncbi:MAG: tetratricopeptide repeat protein [Myxococcota bacterium]
MSSTSTQAPPRSSAPPDERALISSIERLRAEHDAGDNAALQALLLHEIGVLEERFGDEAAAARDYLAAVNGDPDFREPLERLVAIIERRQSYKNLGRVLERLVRVADTAEERARSLVDQAAFLADQQSELDAARAALLDAAEQTPDDASIWLALELIATRVGDGELLQRALSSRAALTQNSTLRALLLIDLAEQRAQQGELDGAFEALERAVAQGGEATYLALLAQERLARENGLQEAEARALETQGELMLRAIAEPSAGDGYGIPQFRRVPAQVAEVWLRAALLHRTRGDAERSASLLDRALAEAPNEPLLLHARLELADAVADTSTAARLAEAELALGVDGEAGACLWLRLADAAMRDGETDKAVNAVEKALGLAPASVVARALDLGLRARGEASSYASALESLGEQFEQDAAKANSYLDAAYVWAQQANDVSGAKAALSQAALYGASPLVVARVARMLAAVLGEATWYEDSTRRLLAQGASEGELVDLWLELSRTRALRGDGNAAYSAFASIASSPGGAWLGNALAAYVGPWLMLPDVNESAAALPSAAALKALSELEAEPSQARALRTLVALRALLRGDLDMAQEELAALHEDSPDDLVVMSALSLLLVERGDVAKARDVLERSASEANEAELGAALSIAAGMASWQLDERPRAVEAFQRAAEQQPDAGINVLGWALRAADPNDPSARARALDALAESDPALAQLERFTLELGRKGASDAAWQALSSLGSSNRDITHAGELAQALWGVGDGADLTRREALKALSSWSPATARLAHAVLHQMELAGTAAGSSPDAFVAMESARTWAGSDTSPVPALEWLSFALATNDREEEVSSRNALAARLSEPASHTLAASAALVAELSGNSTHKLLDGEHPAIKLANLEVAAPGRDPGLRSRALLGALPSLGEECSPMATAMAGFNQLAAGDIEGATQSFRTVIEAFPDEVIGWEGLRGAALASGDRATLAEASAALGDAVSDDVVGARLWEEAATILLDELEDTQRGEYALSRATERDIELFSAFDRLFRMVRARKDGPRLLELIERRLTVAIEPAEVIRLHWERARVLREAGDRERALAELERVRELEPDHVGALALTGEICITMQRFEEAAENLSRLAEHPEAPQQQRLMSGVAAVDLYEGRLKNLPRALEVLSALYRAGLSTLPVRERLARTAARAEAWEQATEVLEQLMNERETSAGRIEAARLAMAIYRDELRMPEAAEAAASRLLEEAPDDGEALDLVLTSVFSESLTRNLLVRGLEALTQKLERDPLNRERVDRLARIAGELGRLPLRQAALGALVALGGEARAIDAELSRLDERVARQPRIAIDGAAFATVADPGDRGPIGEMISALASTIAETLGPNLTTFNVGKRERVDPRAGLAVRNEIAAWAGAFGIGEFELYIGGNDAEGVCGIPTETPAVVIGRDVTAPLRPFHRQAVARELLALRRGTSVILHREPDEIHALVVAACRIAEVEVPSPPFALLGEFQRLLGKMPRRVRNKVLPDLARAVASSSQQPAEWYRAARSTLDRIATVAAGDVSWVLTANARQRGHIESSMEGQARAKRLLSFVLSPAYLELREKLGMGVR